MLQSSVALGKVKDGEHFLKFGASIQPPIPYSIPPPASLTALTRSETLLMPLQNQKPPAAQPVT